MGDIPVKLRDALDILADGGEILGQSRQKGKLMTRIKKDSTIYAVETNHPNLFGRKSKSEKGANNGRKR